uniref:Uncharacterized protein n=1 Tax=Pithovirus LCPAC406 TaxID=2506599 RepID=A0A481ZDB5_9VIRU|nr:MAG: uncharacterized protein LCPAC406_02670 [Pithovirus LCPAC406]
MTSKPPTSEEPEVELFVPSGITAINLPHTNLRAPGITTISRHEEDIKPTVEIPGAPSFEEEKVSTEPVTMKPAKPVTVGGIHVHMVQPVALRERPPRTRRRKDDPFSLDLTEMKISTDIPHAATFQPHRVSREKPTPLPVSGAPLDKPTLGIRKVKIDFSSFNIQPINIPILGNRLFVSRIKNLKTLELPITSSKIMKPIPLPKMEEVHEEKTEDIDIDISMINWTGKRGESYTIPQLIEYIKKYSGGSEKPVKKRKKELVLQLRRILRDQGYNMSPI